MKQNIIDEFGQQVVAEVYDRALSAFLQYANNQITNQTNEEIQDYKKLFISLDREQKKYSFHFLRIK